MRKPLLNSGKNGLKMLSKSFLTFMTIMLVAINLNAQATGSIVDSCTCLSNQTYNGNGQFSAILQINNGTGNWYIAQDSIRGLFKNPSPTPPSPPDVFTTGAGGDFMTSVVTGVFTLPVIHIDGQGFWVKLTNGTDTVEFVLNAGSCNYPYTEIVGDPFVCEGQISDYTTQNNLGSTYSWTLNHGGTITSAVNTNTITVDWDDDSDGRFLYQRYF